MHKATLIIIISIALTAHTTRAMLVQRIKIMINYFLCRLLPVLRHGEGHKIPYHKVYNFGFSTAGNRMAGILIKKLHLKNRRSFFIDERYIF